MIALLQTSQKTFVESEGLAAGVEPIFAVSSESLATTYVETFGSFGLPGSFFTRQYYLLV